MHRASLALDDASALTAIYCEQVQPPAPEAELSSSGMIAQRFTRDA
jgi:hypothetical protein